MWNSTTRRTNSTTLMVAACVLLLLLPVRALPQVAPDLAVSAEPERVGYVVDVQLPLVGDRDELAKRQVRRIADVNRDALQRPVVVLRFAVDPIANVDLEAGSGMGSRGSQFERCLSLARFLTSPDAARVRLVAYLPDTVEGHAVLPVLACEEILANSTAELGRAAIDEPLDASIEGAYRDVVSRRATLPLPIVQAMLDGTAEVYLLELADGGSLVADRAEAAKRREAGEVLREETIWAGGGLAQFSGQQLRNRRWIARTLDDPTELSDALDLSGALRTSQQLPRDWRPVRLSLSGELSTSRVNQIIRAVDDAVDKQQVNLLVVELSQTTSNFSNASRLANYIAGLNAEQVYSLGIVTQSLTGPASLIPVACDEAVLLSTASLGPMIDAIGANGLGAEGNVGDAGRAATARLVLGDLAETTNRPLPLLSALIDPSVIVNEYVHQDSGKRAIFAEWQIAKQANAQQWLAKKRVAGGEPLPNDIALRYRLVDAIDDTSGLALSRLGVEEMPPELKTPWLDATIQRVLAQGWLPRLLLTIGFFALMIELGNPGISAGGLLASLCFLGFFWIEGLNGNVEALEVLLFVGGLIALGIELFVLPGFGLFGIGGLVMLLVSVVLASQTFIWPTTSAQLSEVASNLFWVSCMAMGGMIGLLFMHRQLENSPLLRWVTLEPASADELDELEMREAIVHREHLLGQEGITTTRLNPSGKAQFGRDIVAVVGTGKMIGEGVPVRVVEVRGNLILVEDCADM
ncbi:MAG: NfeD family protein [Pirellulaceae bacterium]